MTYTFPFLNRKRFANTFSLILGILGLILFSGLTLLFYIKENEIPWPLLSVAAFNLIIMLVYMNKLFFAKVTISPEGITYKSLFTKQTLKMHEIRDFKLVQRRRRGTDIHPFSFPSRTNAFNNFYFMVMTTFKTPDGPFLMTQPIGENYITIQETEEVYRALRKFYNTWQKERESQKKN